MRRPILVVLSLILACALGPEPASAQDAGAKPGRARPAGAPARVPARSPGRIELRDPQAPPPLRRRNPAEFGYRHDYRFSQDWFTHAIPSWAALFEPYMGRPGLRYLEVGVFQGRSFLWVIDHVLTGEGSHATGIDIIVVDELRENIELSGASDRVDLIQGSSQVELSKLPLESYDVVYIDGSHAADDVLEDIVLSWRLLKPGGLMILDDYMWKIPRGKRAGQPQETPDELIPKIAIDSFVSVYRNFVEVVYKDYQMALRKRGNDCVAGTQECSIFGAYNYDWKNRVLYEGSTAVELTDAERRVVEDLIRARTGDGLTLRVHRTLRDSPELRALDERLGLGLGLR